MQRRPQPIPLVTTRCLRASLVCCLFLIPSLYIQMHSDRWNMQLKKFNRSTLITSAETLMVSGLSFTPHSPYDETKASVLPASQDIAVCITGHLRSFYHQSVHTSIQTNLINVLNRTGATVHVFFHIAEDDVPRAGTTRAKQTDVAAVLHSFHPVSVSHYRSEKLHPPRLPSCNTARVDMAYPYALLRTSQCLQQIRRMETKRGSRYAWIYKTRPDIAFIDPLADPSSLSPDTLYMNQHDPGASIHSHDWLRLKFPSKGHVLSGAVADHVLVASRQVAEVAFEAIHALASCDLYDLPMGTLNSEVVFTYWLVRNGIKFQSLPWLWLLVRDTEGPECNRLRWIHNEPHARNVSLEDLCKQYSRLGSFPIESLATSKAPMSISS